MSDAVDVPTPTPSRIKRNSACTSCRDAKCSDAGRPPRSKIDELVQEIQTIKQTVGSSHPTGGIVAAPTAPFPKDPPLPQPVINSPDAIRASLSDKSAAASGPSITETPATTLVGDVHIEPSLPRALGSQPFSGEDIDYYFNVYFEHFHPYMPIVRHRDPKQMLRIRASAVLDDSPGGLSALRQKPAGPTISGRCHQAGAVLRPVKSAAQYAHHQCDDPRLHLGLSRSGKGSNPAFSFGGFQGNFTDEEAHYTWAGYNIVTQRAAHYMGLPPLGSLFNQTVQNVIDGRTPFHVHSSFRILLECQKFAHRVSKTMSACMEESEGVSSYIVQQLENDFDNIRGLICSERADDMDKFNALLVQLEIQTYYLIPLPGYSPEALKRNILRAYTTAQAVLRDALSLDDRHGYLKHMPHFSFRSLLSAMCIIYKVFRSSYKDILDKQAAERSAAHCMEVCRRSVVQEGDLGARLSVLFESFWSLAQSTAVWHGEPTVTVGTHRMGAGVCFNCLKLWKSDMNTMRPRATMQSSHTEGGGIGGGGSSTIDALAAVATGTATLGTGTVTGLVPDPLANIDWSFMDEFDWNFEPNLLAPVGLGT
ncbi:hypothetical protein PG994_011736 [Apiospora phragmitis]|uniref:Uncharacterized protein n=1 Tax=Apiospora phragmitis TaxID=2905665 RepID=A0ABR1TTM1_9PEZI